MDENERPMGIRNPSKALGSTPKVSWKEAPTAASAWGWSTAHHAAMLKASESKQDAHPKYGS